MYLGSNGAHDYMYVSTNGAHDYMLVSNNGSHGDISILQHVLRYLFLLNAHWG